MTYAEFAVLFAIIGIALLAAEALLPSHGLLGIAAAISFLLCVIYCFFISATTGLLVFAALVVAGPVIAIYMIDLWPHTPVGRRLVLPKTTDVAAAPDGAAPPAIGSRGIAVTELRPMGVCEFSGRRVEAASASNIIAAGSAVEVISLEASRPIVKAVS